jgi:hypothetical protein
MLIGLSADYLRNELAKSNQPKPTSIPALRNEEGIIVTTAVSHSTKLKLGGNKRQANKLMALQSQEEPGKSANSLWATLWYWSVVASPWDLSISFG